MHHCHFFEYRRCSICFSWPNYRARVCKPRKNCKEHQQQCVFPLPEGVPAPQMVQTCVFLTALQHQRPHGFLAAGRTSSLLHADRCFGALPADLSRRHPAAAEGGSSAGSFSATSPGAPATTLLQRLRSATVGGVGSSRAAPAAHPAEPSAAAGGGTEGGSDTHVALEMQPQSPRSTRIT